MYGKIKKKGKKKKRQDKGQATINSTQPGINKARTNRTLSYLKETGAGRTSQCKSSIEQTRRSASHREVIHSAYRQTG